MAAHYPTTKSLLSSAQIPEGWYKESVNGLIWCPGCNFFFTGWKELFFHVQHSISVDPKAVRNHNRIREYMDSNACQCGQKDEDYERLFTHIDVQNHDNVIGREDSYPNPAPNAAPPNDWAGRGQFPATAIADLFPLLPTSRMSAQSNWQFLPSTPKSPNLFPHSMPYICAREDPDANVSNPHYPQPHLMERGMALRGPNEPEFVFTDIIRPNGSIALINWMRDEDVQDLILDLNDTGWILVKASILRYHPDHRVQKYQSVKSVVTEIIP